MVWTGPKYGQGKTVWTEPKSGQGKREMGSMERPKRRYHSGIDGRPCLKQHAHPAWVRYSDAEPAPLWQNQRGFRCCLGQSDDS